MLGYLVMFLVIIEMPAAQIMGIDANGVVDEVVVTAPRYANEDIAWSGLMPEVVATAPRYRDDADLGMIEEIVVTAPRYVHEDIAWSGLMPEIICTVSNDNAPPVLLSFLQIVDKGEDRRHYRLLIIETSDLPILIQLN